jgi:Tol biopolymer transport system component
MKDSCFYNQFSFREVIWSNDGKYLAAHVVDTELVNSDQIFLLFVDIPNCANTGPTRVQKFPALNFAFSNKDTTGKIASYNWDGDQLFLLTDIVRNDTYGDLYLYDSESRQEQIINPIEGECCYRDAVFSPDGKYIMFVFQRVGGSDVSLYYVPLAEVGRGKTFTPIELPDLFFPPREKPQPILRPAQ